MIRNVALESCIEPRNYDRLASLLLLAPNLFREEYKTVLYIGARESRFDFGNLLGRAGYKITILEAHQANAIHLNSLGLYEVIHGDITTYDFQKRKFDIVFWWHGPEHIEFDQLENTVKKLESIASKLVILGCPYGIYEQGELEGNPYEVHKSHHIPHEFICLNYDVIQIGEKDIHGSNITAVKHIHPFISIITRHFVRRPSMIEENKKSIEKQLDNDYEHMIIEDEIGIGVPLANGLLWRNKDRIKGDYVIILDDDNIFETDDFISDMKVIAAEHNPDVIFIKKIANDIVFPRESSWNTGNIAIAEIDTSCFVIKNSLWQRYISYFFNGGLCGDFTFISKIMEEPEIKVFWQDKIYTKALRISGGAPE